LQEHKNVFVPNQWLDGALTLLFALEVIYVAQHMWYLGYLPHFIALLLLTDAVISRIKTAAFSFGKYLSTAVYQAKLVNSEPLSGKVQMKKWTEQSWQLVVHTVFAGLEWYLLTVEPWYERPETQWVPHPDAQAKNPGTFLLVVYLAQLVRFPLVPFFFALITVVTPHYLAVHLDVHMHGPSIC
jgi:hypothetical protein